MESAKRKRDDDLPRITYHASGRTFDRLFKEKSLDETREVVRRKLGLQLGAVVKLKQLRGGKAIDLEDEDDFDAFRALARSVMSVDVRVTTSTPTDDPTSAKGTSEATGAINAPTLETNSTQTADLHDSTPGVARTSKAPTPGSRRKVAFGNSSSSAANDDSAEGSAPKTKRRKSGAASEVTPLKSTLPPPSETLVIEDDASFEPPTPIHPPKKSGRAKSNKASTNTGAEESGLTSAPVIPPRSTSNATQASAAEKASEDLDGAAPSKNGRMKKGTKDVSGDNVVHDMDSGKRSGKKNAKEPRDAGVYVELPTSHAPSVQSPSVPRKKSKTPKERTATGENAQTTETETAAKEPSKRTKVSAGPKKKEYATFDDETLKGIIASAAATTNAKALERMNSVRDSQPAETKKKKRKREVQDEEPIDAPTHSAEDAEPASKKRRKRGDDHGEFESASIKSGKKAKRRPAGDSIERDNDTATSLTEAQSIARQTVEDGAVARILAKLAAKRGSRSSSATDPSTDQSKAKHPVKPRASKRENAKAAPEPIESDGEDGAEKPSSSIAQGPSALLSRIIASRGISKGSGSNLLPCPVCLQEPFHVRYRCPVILGGPPRIRERLDELRKAGGVEHRELIEELEDLIPGPVDQGNAIAQHPSSPGGAPPSCSVSPGVPSNSEPNSTTKSSSEEVLRGLSSPLHPLIPDGSHISEVTVETRDEGSSSDSSDEEEGAGEDSLIVQRKQEPTNTNPLSLEDTDLEAIMRGPTSSRSILDDIPSSDDNADEPEGKLEEEDADDRRFRRLSRRYERDAESSEERDAASPSGDHEDEDAPPPLPATIDLENVKIASEQKATTREAIMPGGEAENQGGACEQLADSADDTQVEPSIGTEDDTEVSVPGTTIPEKEPSPVVPDVAHTLDEAANPEVDDDTELGAPDDQLRPDGDSQDEVDRARSPDPTTGEQKQDAPISLQPSPIGISTAESHATPIDLSAEQEHQEDAADPIEPADDIAEPPLDDSVHDPIEVTTPTTPNEKTFVPPMSQSTPKPGVTKRMKNRGGKVPLSQLELPVSVLEMEAKDLVTPLPAKKTGRKAAPVVTPASQDSVARRTRNSTRRSASVVDDAPVSSTPVAVSRPITRGERVASKAAQTTKRTGAPAEEGNAIEPTVPMSDPLATVISSATPALRQPTVIPQSLDKWTILAEPSSPSFMLDQLRSSSPQEGPETSSTQTKPGTTAREGDADVDDNSGDETLKREPLFILSQAQTPFPYSQWNGPVVPPKEQVAESTSSTESESDNDLGVGRSKVKATPVPRSQKPAVPYRRLTDIASSQALFSQDILVPRSSPLKPAASTKKLNKYDDDDDDDEPSSDSDSDSNSKSHIPAGKRAGSGLQRKGGRGLSSFT